MDSRCIVRHAFVSAGSPDAEAEAVASSAMTCMPCGPTPPSHGFYDDRDERHAFVHALAARVHIRGFEILVLDETLGGVPGGGQDVVVLQPTGDWQVQGGWRTLLPPWDEHVCGPPLVVVTLRIQKLNS